MSKWICSHCKAVNLSGAFECHNCPNTSGDERWHTAECSQLRILLQESQAREEKLLAALKAILPAATSYRRLKVGCDTKEIIEAQELIAAHEKSQAGGGGKSDYDVMIDLSIEGTLATEEKQ